MSRSIAYESIVPPARAAQSAAAALQRLREGNLRFVQNVRSVDTLLSQTARAALVGAQAPFAIVVGCSDSRGPAELVFDQGLGDLFVARVAGNVVCPSVLGSVEFAVAAYDTPLVVVMGHSRCGAIRAAFDAFHGGGPPPPAHVAVVLDRVRPAVDAAACEGASRAAVLAEATRINVRNALEALRRGGDFLEERIASGRLAVVGAEYALETGRVDFFDGAPA